MTLHTADEGAQRTALRGRVRRFYRYFEQSNWKKCFDLIDPRLRLTKVDYSKYSAALQRFAEVYGEIAIRHIDLGLHLDAVGNKHDDRPFAYVYIIWRDKRHAFHVFSERWIKHDDDWYTRVVGLIAHDEPNRVNGKG